MPLQYILNLLRQRQMVRWWLVGMVFAFLNVPFLYAFHDVFGLPLTGASLLAGELGALVRFLVNDHWVFGHPRPTLHRVWQYHVAAASSFAIWWAITNALPFLGISYLIASLVGTACSVGWSMVTNFLWIWRTPRQASPQAVLFAPDE